MSEKLKPIMGGLNQIANKIRAYHGSPHKFDRFDISKIGTGEGNQAYGHGLYFAENPEVAKSYRQALGGGPLQSNVQKDLYEFLGVTYHPAVSGELLDRIAYHGQRGEEALKRALIQLSKDQAGGYGHRYAQQVQDWASDPHFIKAMSKPYGHLYEVDLNVPRGHLLDWDAPFSQQSAALQKAIEPFVDSMVKSGRHGEYYLDAGRWHMTKDAPGNHLWGHLTNKMSPPDAAQELMQAGIPGIQYFDGSSRKAGTGTRNYVMFDDAPIEIVERKAKGGILRRVSKHV